MRIFSIILIYALLCFSCAQDLVVDYPDRSSDGASVLLKPTSRVSNTYVTVNDQLLVDKRYIKSVEIQGLPKGQHSVHFSSESSRFEQVLSQKLLISVEEDSKVTKIIDVPPYSMGYWMYIGTAMLPSLILLYLVAAEDTGN